MSDPRASVRREESLSREERLKRARYSRSSTSALRSFVRSFVRLKRSRRARGRSTVRRRLTTRPKPDERDAERSRESSSIRDRSSRATSLAARILRNCRLPTLSGDALPLNLGSPAFTLSTLPAERKSLSFPTVPRLAKKLFHHERELPGQRRESGVSKRSGD